MLSNSELLAIQFATDFVFESSGRIATRNDPDRSRAPRFALSCCASGNVCGIRADVADDIAAELMGYAALEPPCADQSGVPRHLGRYIELLSRDAIVQHPRLGVTYVLPNDISYKLDIKLICSDSVAGEELCATVTDEGLPAGLAEMGFRGEFWAPWCVALYDREVASVAFAARLSATGADLGLATAPRLRGRGFAAAATAGWARMPELRSRALFYNTDQTNVSSQRVVARLGLRYLGLSLELS